MERFGIKKVEFELVPRYNIAPQQQVAVVVQNPEIHLIGMRWGLIPIWAKDPKIGNKMINARAETIREKRVFKSAFEKRRCLVLASGFYEWQKIGKTKKPMAIRMRDQEPFAFAGIYENWKSPTGTWIRSCAIITTKPNQVLAPIHNRMPVILEKENEIEWINPDNTDFDSLETFLTPHSEEKMESFEVSTYVNNPRNEGPTCARPISTVQDTLE